MSKFSGWRGCSNVGMRGHGEWADPELVIESDGDTFVFNYWDIESALWDYFLEANDLTDDEARGGGNIILPEYEDAFDEYCQAEAYDYMQDIIFSLYESGELDSWWDPYNVEYAWDNSKDVDIASEIAELLGDYPYDTYRYLTRVQGKKFDRIGKNYYVDSVEIGDIDYLKDYLYEHEPDWEELSDEDTDITFGEY